MSPIYDRLTGAYLGNDSQGFKGDILFTDKSKFERMSISGPIDHNVAEISFLKINNNNIAGNIAMVFGGTGIDLKAVSGAYTDILSKSGFSTDKLYNAAVSINYNKDGLSSSYNSPISDNFSKANTEWNWNGTGKINVTAQFTNQSGSDKVGDQSLSYFTTVGNVQEGLGNHELNFHGIKGLSDHAKIFNQEVNNSPYLKNTTKEFKQYINDQNYHYNH